MNFDEMMLVSIEMAKLDPSGAMYEVLRFDLRVYLALPKFDTEPLPAKVREFITAESRKETPFYPAKSKTKAASQPAMERAMRVGCRIQALRHYGDRRAVFESAGKEGLINALAREENKSIATIRDDYTKRYLPIWKKACDLAGLSKAQRARGLGMAYQPDIIDGFNPEFDEHYQIIEAAIDAGDDDLDEIADALTEALAQK